MSLRPSKSKEMSRASGAEKVSTSLSSLEQSILLTVLYADIFDYPLTGDELYRRLIECSVSRDRFDRALEALNGTYLETTAGFITWHDREELVERRRSRRSISEEGWKAARQYGNWLRWIPFMRAVVVSGSLALDNATSQGDVDLFCITDRRRLWITRLWLVPLSKTTRAFSGIFPWYMCPNYLLTVETLKIEKCNLFTAYEAEQAVPLWGEETYDRFMEANRWMRDYVPNSSTGENRSLRKDRGKPWLTRALEWLLNGTVGEVIDRWAHRIFLGFYRKRARRNEWPWDRLKEAYRRQQYTVPEGGYIRIVHRYFRRHVRERLGRRIPEERLQRLFPGELKDGGEHCYNWTELFEEEYGTPSPGLRQTRREA